MAFQSRKRGYKSRRERFEKTKRDTKLILWFALAALVVYTIMRRHDILGWLKTYLY